MQASRPSFLRWLLDAFVDFLIAVGWASLRGLVTALCMGVVYFGFAVVWAIQKNETLLSWNVAGVLAFGIGVIFFAMTPLEFVRTFPETRARRHSASASKLPG